MGKERQKLRDIHYNEWQKHKKKECEKCGIGNSFMVGDYVVRRKILTIHHIDNDILNNKPKNLMTLCRNCHNKIHDK